MDVKTNTLQKYVDAFGEVRIVAALEKIDSINSPGRIIQVTNPIMRFLKNTTYIKSSKVYTHKNLRVPPGDYSYFYMVSAILADLATEIKANSSYAQQLAEKILHSQTGPMLSAMNEILVAAYYKYLGIKITLNSSAQEGAADIDLVDLPFASDTKTYPNNRLLLEAIVNSSAQQIVDAVQQVRNQGLLVSVFNPNKKQFQQSLRKLAEAFEGPNAGSYSDSTISAMIIGNDYSGAAFHISIQPQNVNMFFQASWDMAPSIEEAKGAIEKAVKQAKVLSKQAIPWIMVPRDAGRNGIELNMLRFVAKLHEYVFQHKDIYVMPVYSIEFSEKGVSTVFDIYQTGQNTLGIKAETFRNFVQGLMSRPELHYR